MIQMIRSIFGENVRTPDVRIMVDETELTPAGVRTVIQHLRLRNQEIENIAHHRQMQILSLLKENFRLKEELRGWVDEWRSTAQKVDIKSA